MQSVSELSKSNNYSLDNIKHKNHKAANKFGCLDPLYYNLYGIRGLSFGLPQMHKSPLNPLSLCKY